MSDGEKTFKPTKVFAYALTIPVFILYFYVIGEFEAPLSETERIVAWMLYAIVGMVLIGMIAVRLDPRGMSYIFMLGALLQTFAMFLMLVVEWHTTESVVFLNGVLIISLLIVGWTFRGAADVQSG